VVPVQVVNNLAAPQQSPDCLFHFDAIPIDVTDRIRTRMVRHIKGDTSPVVTLSPFPVMVVRPLAVQRFQSPVSTNPIVVLEAKSLRILVAPTPDDSANAFQWFENAHWFFIWFMVDWKERGREFHSAQDVVPIPPRLVIASCTLLGSPNLAGCVLFRHALILVFLS